MTSYTNESYLYTSYNNENDALTCNSRPISSTLQNGKYGSNFQNIEGTYYDFGNSSYVGDFKTSMDMNACYQKQPIGSTTLDYTATLNDNSLYDTTGADALQEVNMSTYMADIHDPGGGNSSDYSVSYSNAYNGRLSALGDEYSSKTLPQAPLKQSSSMFDGMYNASGTGGCGGSQQWQQGFRASQQATPPVARSRMLPHPTALTGGVVGNDYASIKRQRPLQQLNGFQNPPNYTNAASLQTGSGNVRILPQPHAPLSKTCDGTSMLKRRHFQDTMNRGTTSTPNYFYDKRTINQDQDLRFNNSGSCDIYSWAEPLTTSNSGATFDIDNFCPLQNQQRPHTSMAPFHFYRDGDGDYGESGYYADDNLSTYSDTPITLSGTTSASLPAAAQQKLQQQRKLSLMMAMTTASVIASGETRIAPNKKKPQVKPTSPTNKGTENRENLRTAKYSDAYSRKYDVTDSVSISTTLANTTAISNSINYNSNNVSIAPTNTTNRASQFLSAATCIPKMVAATESYGSLPTEMSLTSVTTPVTSSPVARPTRARKLPKCLPTIPKSRKTSEKNNAAIPTAVTATTVVSGNKILPKLPIMAKSNNNLYEKDRIEPFTATPSASSSTLVISPSTHLPNAVAETADTTTCSSAFVSAAPSLSSNKIGELTSLSSHLATPDLSNNNSNANLNNNSSDYFTSTTYSNIDDHKSSPLTSASTSNAISNVYNIMPSSTSQAATSVSSTKTFAPSQLSPTLITTSSNIDYLDYLKSYTFPTEAKFIDVENSSSSNGNNLVSLPSTTLDPSNTIASATTTKATVSFSHATTVSQTGELLGTIAENENFNPKTLTSLGLPDKFNKNLEPPIATTTGPDILTNYSAYINSFTTTTASSPSTPLKVFSSVTESLVPLEASATLTFTSNTYLDSLNSCSDNSSKLDDTIVAKPAPLDISFGKTNSLDIMTILPSTYPLNDIPIPTSKMSEENIPASATTSQYCTDAISNGDIFTESYADYLKQFELPELPPLLTATETSNKSDINAEAPIENHQQQLSPLSNEKVITTTTETNEAIEAETQKLLPSYVTDFLKDDYSKKYEFLNDYKINDFQESSTEAQPITVNTTVTNLTLAEESSPFYASNSTMSTTISTALPTPLVATAPTKEANESYDFYSEYSKNDNDDYATKYAWNVDDVTLTPATSIALSNDGGISDTKATSNENLLPVSTSISTAFDDSFYDSFKVDLDTLTAVITSDEQSSMTTTITTTATSNNFLESSSTANATFQELAPKPSYSTSNEYGESVAPTSTVSTQGGYYRPVNTKPLVTSAAPAEEVIKPPSTTASAASKATSLIGGLSKGIKGSLLDGVLTGVGATASQPQQQATSKKGFGFNLASKLVPNVGGLLTGASAAKTTTKPTPSTTSAPASAVSVSSAKTTTMMLGGNDSSSRYTKPLSSEIITYDIESFKEEGPYGNYENRDDYCDVDYNNQQLPEYNFGIQNTDNTGTTDFDEYGVGVYSEYEDYNMANVYAVESGPIMTTEPPATHQECIAATTAGGFKDSIGSSLLSTISNITVTHDQSLQQQHKAEPMESKSGGVFGSFLGKAAAAVQSATQAVNQGAAAIVQQHKAPATIAMQDQMVTGMTTSTSVALNNAYSSQQQLQQQNQHDSLLGLQTYSSITMAAGTDYENSNMVAVYNHEDPLTGMNTNNYYSNGNQSQPPTVTTAKMLPTVPAVGKKLPNITNGSKSGIGYLIKQQPTEIYDEDDIEHEYEEGKSPNHFLSDNGEPSDYYQDIGHSKDLMPKTAHLNGYYEQHHSFHDPVGSSSGGYDYREDYFDEEDEYKYLEREAEAEQERIYRQQHKQQKLLSQHQKQSASLEYIEESHIEADDDAAHDGFFNDDNYPSEDSGNYLDESSSGSVGGVVIKGQRERTNATISDSLTLTTMGAPTQATRSSVSTTQSAIGSHQPIKKQDSIILEEDDKISMSLADDLIESPVPMTDMSNATNGKAAFRRQSSDIAIEDDLSIDNDINDRLGDLPPSNQRKKKVLIRGETEEVVGGHMQFMKRQKPPEVTAKQRWHWAYNKIIMQLNVSTNLHTLYFSNKYVFLCA